MLINRGPGCQPASLSSLLQYWTGNQLSPVPEGLPMINTPPPSSPWNQMSVRHSTGNMDPDTAAQRLSSDFGRMSFDSADTSNEAVQVQQGGWAGGYGPPRVNPYASSFFGGGAASDW